MKITVSIPNKDIDRVITVILAEMLKAARPDTLKEMIREAGQTNQGDIALG